MATVQASIFKKPPKGSIFAPAGVPTPDSMASYSESAQALTRGSKGTAESEAQDALQKDPSNSPARRILERLKVQGSTETTKSTDLYKQGYQAFVSGDEETAAKVWLQAIQEHPNDSEARKGIERIAARHGLALVPEPEEGQ